MRLDEYGGKPRVDIRKWYIQPPRKKMPTKQGVSIPIDRVLELRRALRKAVRIARAHGVLPPDGKKEDLNAVRPKRALAGQAEEQ